MTYVLICLVAVLVVLAVVAGRVLPWAAAVRRRVLVVTLDGQSIEGVLLRRSGPVLVLGSAAVIANGSPVALDGTVIVERSTVAWVQVCS